MARSDEDQAVRCCTVAPLRWGFDTPPPFFFAVTCEAVSARAASSIGFAARTLSASLGRSAVGATNLSLSHPTSLTSPPSAEFRQGDWSRPQSYLDLGEFATAIGPGGGGTHPLLQRCNGATVGEPVRGRQDLNLGRHRLAQGDTRRTPSPGLVGLGDNRKAAGDRPGTGNIQLRRLLPVGGNCAICGVVGLPWAQDSACPWRIEDMRTATAAWPNPDQSR